MAASFLFIDARVPDIDTLLAGFPPEAEVMLLDLAQDGVQQIAAVLAGQSDIDAIHIISHGAEGTLFLGDAVLNSSSLAQYRSELEIIDVALKPDGDILLYGCDVANGANGKAFIEQLAAYTRADVAASTDTTGAALLGGNWLLEANTGSIEVQALAPQGFTGTLAATLPSGALDPTFNGDGTVITSLGTAQSAIKTMAIQPDGKIVVAGYSGSNFALARYNTDGSLDSTFDGDGIVIDGTNLNPAGHNEFRDVALQADGRIVVAGFSTSSLVSDSEFALARYNTDGSLDTTFGGDGLVTTNIGIGSDVIDKLQLLADGRILVGGSNKAYVALARYNADGSVDVSFDEDGKLFTTVIDVPGGLGNLAGVSALLMQADGKPVAVSFHARQVIVVQALTFYGSDLIRYEADGTLDPTLDGDGKSSINFTDQAQIHANSVVAGPAILQADGKFILAVKLGYISSVFSAPYDWDFPADVTVLARYNTDGSRDDTFALSPIGFGVTGMAVQSDGKIVVAGTSPDPQTDSGRARADFALARFNSDGQLDAAFANDGILMVPVGTGVDVAASVQVQTDGSIVVAGYTGSVSASDFALIRVSGSTGIEDFTIPQNAAFNYTVATHPESGAEAYSAALADGQSLPVWLHFDPASHTFSGATGPSEIGRHEVVVIITHVGGATTTDHFTFAVTNFAATTGNDVLYGGIGADTMAGLSGDDVYWVDGYLDGVVEAAGEGTDLVRANVNHTLVENVENLTLFGTGNVKGRGNSLNNVIEGNDGNNNLWGLDGADTLNGGNGNDSLDGGPGDDNVIGAAGNDTLIGGDGLDALDGGAGDDILLGKLDGETLVGGEGIDTVSYAATAGFIVVEIWNARAFGANVPRIDTLLGFENVIGTSGNDTLSGDGANNSFRGGGGYDALFGGEGIDTVDFSDAPFYNVKVELWRSQAVSNGWGASDYLSSIENVIGSRFNDTLIGDGGDNAFKGGAGFDEFYGGTGTDTVDYSDATSGVFVELWKSQSSNDGQGAADYLNNIENLIGSRFNDILIGDGGDNVFKGGAGFDQFYGGSWHRHRRLPRRHRRCDGEPHHRWCR